MLIGYARVSTADQDLALQIDALNAAGCEHIATDKASGASVVRPGLTEALGKARKGDTLVIWKLDRLGRSMKGLVDLAAELSARGIALRSLTDGIDTATHTGRLVFHILGSIAEMERELIRERTMAGLAARRKAGGGRRAQIRHDAPQKRHGRQTARRWRPAAGRRRSGRRVGFDFLSALSGQWQGCPCRRQVKR